MSDSYYRGKVVTNRKLKGPFTEASDTFLGAFNALKKEQGSNITSIFVGDKLMFIIGSVWFTLTREGLVEVGQSAA